MKLENFSNLFFIVSVLVPGFIYNGVLSNFIPTHSVRDKEVVFLRFFTATAFNYALCSPGIYLLIFGLIFSGHPVKQAFCWFMIIFIVPIVLALINAWLVQKDRLGGLYRLLGLRAINPVPTGWDWVFSTTEPCYLLVTLIDGTEIAGYFGKRSLASSDPERKDIFVERVYTVPEDGSAWRPVERSLGMHVDGARIAYIEFRG